MRLGLAHILIGILLLSVVAMELRGRVEGFQTAAVPADILCTLTTQFGRGIWLCEDGNQSKKLLAGQTNPAVPKYVSPGDQVCIKKDKSEQPGTYSCMDWERVKGEKDMRGQVLQDHSDTCDELVSAYWDFTDNLATVDQTAGVLKDAVDTHKDVSAQMLALSTRAQSPELRSFASSQRLSFNSKLPLIEQHYTNLNTQLTSSTNPRNVLQEAVNHFRCKLY